MPSLPTGLVRHRRSKVYYLRHRTPTDLLACYSGRKEITRSHKTKDHQTAIRLHRVAEAELTFEWQQHRERLAEQYAQQTVEAVTQVRALTPEAIAEICAHFETLSLASDDARRASDPYSDEEFEKRQADYRGKVDDYKKALGRGHVYVFRGALDQFLDLAGYRVSATEDDMLRLARAYAHMVVQTNEKLLKRLDGEDVPTPVFKKTVETPLLSKVVHEYIAHYETLGHPAMLKKVSATLTRSARHPAQPKTAPRDWP